jgi:hypothetical protein
VAKEVRMLQMADFEGGELVRVTRTISEENEAIGARVWSARFEFPRGNAAEAVRAFARERAVGARLDGASAVVVEFHPTLTDAIVRCALAMGGVVATA